MEWKKYPRLRVLARMPMWFQFGLKKRFSHLLISSLIYARFFGVASVRCEFCMLQVDF
jgi:hypothetical protein